MLAITVPINDKFSCVIAGKVIGTSKHSDYFEYHYRLRDLKSLRDADLTKFVRVDDKGQVENVLLAEALHSKDTKAAILPTDSLTEGELEMVCSAFELVTLGKASDSNLPLETSAAESLDETTGIPPVPVSPIEVTPTKQPKKKSRSKSARNVRTPNHEA